MLCRNPAVLHSKRLEEEKHGKDDKQKMFDQITISLINNNNNNNNEL